MPSNCRLRFGNMQGRSICVVRVYSFIVSVMLNPQRCTQIAFRIYPCVYAVPTTVHLWRVSRDSNLRCFLSFQYLAKISCPDRVYRGGVFCFGSRSFSTEMKNCSERLPGSPSFRNRFPHRLNVTPAVISGDLNLVAQNSAAISGYRTAMDFSDTTHRRMN